MGAQGSRKWGGYPKTATTFNWSTVRVHVQGPQKPEPPKNLSSASKKWEIEFGPSRDENKMS